MAVGQLLSCYNIFHIFPHIIVFQSDFQNFDVITIRIKTLDTFIKSLLVGLSRSVQIFQPIILIYIRLQCVYHNWGCTAIYRSLSYPLRSLILIEYVFRAKRSRSVPAKERDRRAKMDEATALGINLSMRIKSLSRYIIQSTDIIL